MIERKEGCWLKLKIAFSPLMVYNVENTEFASQFHFDRLQF